MTGFEDMFNQGFFPVFWDHGPNPWDWEFQLCFLKNWGKNTQNVILQLIKWTQTITV